MTSFIQGYLERNPGPGIYIHTYLEVLRREGSFFSVFFSHLESVCCNLQAVHSPDNISNLEMAIVALFLAYSHIHPYMHTYTCI